MQRPRNLIFLSALFIVAGIAHFAIPGSYVAIVPRWVKFPLVAVYVSGVLEALGGAALLIPSLRRVAGICLIALLIAVFPANVQMLTNAIGAGAPKLHVALLLLRLPLQPLLIAWVFRSAVRRDGRVKSASVIN